MKRKYFRVSSAAVPLQYKIAQNYCMGVIDIVYGKTDSVLSAAEQLYRDDPSGLFGPWLLGAGFDCFFLGLLCIQVIAHSPGQT
ncbi:hypothetical protein FRC03_006546 [Tulasnella sp. 419]|nr:hypothetical protein FRC03_006546 [Tulasnella sp. 419]